jgi:L-histidine N-alpha-methyltransferase
MSTTSSSVVTAFAAEVRRDLALIPKQLQSKYLYDPLGSSLFDAICRLPWYRITRAESRLIARHAAEIVRALGRKDGATIVELGCGSGEKLVLLAEALQAAEGHARVHLIDVSSQALEHTEQRLTALQHVSVVGHQSTYEDGLRRAVAAREGSGPMLVLFLGSNIGNFDRPGAEAFLRGVRASLRRGDALLIGADLVKPERDLLLAYDDPLGVTGAFNRNLLVRINRELGGNFDVDQFVHRAVWEPGPSRVEMHLVSRIPQRVRIAAAASETGGEGEFMFAEGETIWTESSYKYIPEQIILNLERAGFRLLKQWKDREDGFALTLGEAA